jgi:Spy/CpxP family protein refolding chaperone
VHPQCIPVVNGPIAKEDSLRSEQGKCPSQEWTGPWLFKTAIVFVSILGTSLAIVPRGYSQTPSGAAVNQPHRRKMPSLDDQLKRYTEVLSLDSSQQAKVKMILDRRQMQLRRVHDDASISAVDRFSAMQALHQQSDEQIRRILNPEQASKFEQIRPRKPPQADSETVTNTQNK